MPGRRFQIGGMAAAEQSGHHRLRDAGREARRDGRVGRGATFLQDLGARLGRGHVARRDGWLHDTRSASRLPNRPNPSIGKSNRAPTSSPAITSNVRSPIARAATSSSSTVQHEPVDGGVDLRPAVAVRVRACESVEHLGRQLDGLGDRPPRPEHALEECVLDLLQRLLAAAARRQADEDGIAVRDHEQRRLEAAVGAGMAPDLDAADPLAEQAEAVDAADGLAVDDAQARGGR